MNRRDFVMAAAAAMAGCYRMRARTDGGLDAIVIGGGLAGLSAATAFEQAGMTCQLVEAQPQLGGRLSTEVVRGIVVGERGAQFVNKDMTRITALMAKHQVATLQLPAARHQFRVSAQGVTPLAEGSARGLRRQPIVDAPVTVVRWGAGAVEVVTSGQTLRANRLVVAVPPPIAARIRFEPELPQPLRVALGAYRTGRMVKTVMRFEAPFWRRDGVATDSLVHSPGGAVLMDMATDEAARLVVFAGADSAFDLAQLDAEARTARILELVSAASGTRAPRPIETVQGVWVDHPWCGGGYNSWVAFGAPVDAPTLLRAGAGPLCFAGSELATRFAGYMEGALHSGEAAAQLLLRRT